MWFLYSIVILFYYLFLKEKCYFFTYIQLHYYEIGYGPMNWDKNLVIDLCKMTRVCREW